MSDLELRKVIREAIQPTRMHGEAIDAIAAALAPVIEARVREARAEALEDAADKFQWGAWIDVLSGGLVQRRTDGEAVVRWLRERSRALQESP